MIKKQLCIATLVLLISFPNISFGQAKSDWLIIPGNRVGLIKPTASEAELRKLYGAENIGEILIELGEGTTEKGTVLFPSKNEQRVEILWQDPIKKEKPARFQWTGQKSLWKTVEGLTLGSRLKDIEVMNGPFKLTGFAWDYAGTVTSWENGKLSTSFAKNGRLLVRLDLAKKGKELTQKEYRSVNGDKVFSSSHPAMQKGNPGIYQMILEIEKN
jgi:hypothetical protein